MQEDAMNYDQSNPTMVPNVNPIISEEQVFNDYRDDSMMDPSMDSRPGHHHEQDYYESEYGSIRSPPPSSFSQPNNTQPSHATNASIKESNVDKIKDEPEKAMTPKAMAAFQQHQDEFIEPNSVSKRFPNDKILARHDSSSSIPCSSDMISVKNIEDREDEYSKMKMALLSEITETSNNGSTSPYIAAITSPSLAHDLITPREKGENDSSVHRDKAKLGPRTRSKDNLESIFGGISGQTDSCNKSVRSPSSVVHNNLVQDGKSISLASHSNVIQNESRLDNGMIPSLQNSRSNIIHSPVNVAAKSSSSSEMSSRKNPPTSNSHSNKSHNNSFTNKDGRDYNRDTTLNNSQHTPKNNKVTNDAKKPSEQYQVYNPANEVVNSYEYSAIPPVNTSDPIELAKYVHKSKYNNNRPQKSHGVITEETYPSDISPESCPRSTDFRTNLVKVKPESKGTMGHEDKKGTTSNIPNISSSATGDFYTIPEVPEEEDASSPPRIGGVAKRRTAGRCHLRKHSSVYTCFWCTQ